jgi:hypothetical protein
LLRQTASATEPPPPLFWIELSGKTRIPSIAMAA